MKIYERLLQALLSSAPSSRVLVRLALLAQIGELARGLGFSTIATVGFFSYLMSLVFLVPILNVGCFTHTEVDLPT